MAKASSAGLLSVVFTAALFPTVLAGGPAEAGVLVVGASLATICSRAAVAGDSRPSQVETCTRALTDEALTPRDRAATHVNRGILLMRRRSFGEARQDFEHAIAQQPELGEAFANRGSVLLVDGRFQDALKDFDRALALGVTQPERTYFNRAVAREWLDDFKGAYLDYRQAAKLNPAWPTPREQMVRFTVVRR
jgi:Flp pilus assembly protein TadD